MATRNPDGKRDEILQSILDRLGSYFEDHPGAKIEVQRRNSVSIRIRVIDHRFKGLGKSERHARIWPYLESLPEEALSDISMMVLITPGEKKTSIANLEFENPSRSPTP